jgi:hypothetical protein
MSNGFLAIWSDVTPDAETDYLHWFSREHSIERLSIPGFQSVRIFRALDVPDTRRFFILYELENEGVMNSAAYLARLNQPTPWSQRIMPTLGNFARGGGRVAARAGTGQGGFVAALKLDAATTAEGAALAPEGVAHDRIAAVQVLQTDHQRTAVQTSEKKLRDKDRSFDGLLIVEGLDAAAVRGAVAALAKGRPSLTGQAKDAAIYEMVFALSGRNL